MKTLKNPINKADLEHYESGMFLAIAYALSNKTAESFSEMPSSTRTYYLDKAGAVLEHFINNPVVRERLSL